MLFSAPFSLSELELEEAEEASQIQVIALIALIVNKH